MFLPPVHDVRPRSSAVVSVCSAGRSLQLNAAYASSLPTLFTPTLFLHMDLTDAAFILSRKHTKSINPSQHTHAKIEKESHKSPPENDLAERPQKAGDDDGKSSKSSAKDKSKSTGKGKSDKTTEINAEAVPVPAPNTGTPVAVIHPGIQPVIPTTLTVPPASFTPGFSPLP